MLLVIAPWVACVTAGGLFAEHAWADSVPVPTKAIEFFEASQSRTGWIAALAEGDNLYLSVSGLVSQLGFERKALGKDRVGVCRGDLCISFQRGDGPDDIRVVHQVGFVPARRLLAGLGGAYVWEAEQGRVLLDLTRRTRRPHPVAGTVDFTLPDLDGRRVSLADFRGKKVILFAWASW